MATYSFTDGEKDLIEGLLLALKREVLTINNPYLIKIGLRVKEDERFKHAFYEKLNQDVTEYQKHRFEFILANKNLLDDLSGLKVTGWRRFLPWNFFWNFKIDSVISEVRQFSTSTLPQAIISYKNKLPLSSEPTSISERIIRLLNQLVSNDKKSNLKKCANQFDQLVDCRNKITEEDVSYLKTLSQISVFKNLEHQDLCKHMIAFGYQTDPAGTCFGLAFMAIQAAQLGEMDVFNKRLELLSKMTPEKLKEEIFSVREKVKLKTPLTPMEEILLEIPAFFDGVELYHNPARYRELFVPGMKFHPQKIKEIVPLYTPMTLSKQLEEKGGIKNVDNFCGVYSKKELISFFSSFKKIIDKISPPLMQPISFSLDSTDHAITVTYEPRSKQWIFVNANHLPTRYCTKTNEIAETVFNAFLSKDFAIFSTHVFLNKKGETELDASHYLNDWKSQKTWCDMHAISFRKVKAKDSSGATWLHSAAICGDKKIIEALLACPALDNVNPVNRDGWTPLMLAVTKGNLDIMTLLLEKNPLFNFSSDEATKLFYFAAAHGDLEIIQFLIKKGVDVDRGPHIPGEVLFVAAKNGHLDVVNTLIEHHANSDLRSKTTIGSLFTFAKYKNVEEKMKAKIKEILGDTVTNDKTEISLSPKDIADVMGHDEIVKALEEVHSKSEISPLPVNLKKS